jgi:cobalamin biosynthesis protein CobD/CbiB
MDEELQKETEQRIAAEVERKVEKGVATGTAIAIAVGVTFVITVILFKFVWAWVIPDLFPGAVQQGLISANLSWFSTIKLAVLASLIGGLGPTLNDAFKLRP